jgi:hypothetical protein
LFRAFRNLSAWGLLTLSFGVMALWVRSYVSIDVVDVASAGVASHAGLIVIRCYEPNNQLNGESLFFLTSASQETLGPYWHVLQGLSGFDFRRDPHATTVYAPHWFFALAFALLSFALKPKPRLKFSLADLLVLMTFSAVLIAGVAGLSRLAS